MIWEVTVVVSSISEEIASITDESNDPHQKGYRIVDANCLDDRGGP